MASIRLGGAARAAAIAFACTAAGLAAQMPERPPEPAPDPAAVTPAAPPPVALSAAATLWQLRSGLNVAALGCRGADAAAIVAGYNRLLAAHRAELNAAYVAVANDYAGAAAFDAAMTRTYNGYARPASQAALCANALSVLARLAALGEAELAGTAAAALADLCRAPAAADPAPLAVAAAPRLPAWHRAASEEEEEEKGARDAPPPPPGE